MTSPQRPRQPLVGLAIAAGTGIVAAEFFSPAPWMIAAVLALLAAIDLLRPNLLLSQLLIGLGFFSLHLEQQTDAAGKALYREIGDRARPVVVTGTVINEPKIAPNEFTTFLLQLRSIEIGGKTKTSRATLAVRWKGKPAIGDAMRLSGMLGPVAPSRNPGVFDLRAYLARHDVYQSLFSRYPEAGTVLAAGEGNFIWRDASLTQSWVERTLSRGLEDSPEVCALISGMALGQRHETPNDIEEPFQQTGTLHLFAVAGLHVGIVAQLLWIVVRLLRLTRKLSAAIIIPSLFFYSAVTGFHVSSVRAATMAAVLLGGVLFERRVYALNSLAAAALMILAADPNQLFSSGFQLSFAVVAAILSCQPPIYRVLIQPAAPDPFLPRSLISRNRQFLERGWAWLARGTSISAAAWIGSLFLIIWYFYLITPISLLANLIVVPIAFFVLATAMLSLLSAPISSWLTLVFNNTNWTLSKIILGLVHLFAQLPTGHIYVERPHWPCRTEADITVLDAGPGAAVHLRSGGNDWLLDAGSARDYDRFLRDYLHSRGINRLDGMVLSHGDSLHIGGAAAAVEEFNPKRICDNAAPDRSRVHRELLAKLKSPELMAAGALLTIAPAVTAQVLYPPEGWKRKTSDDQALVLKLVINHCTRVLLFADGGPTTEHELLLRPKELRSDILIKGQHCSGAQLTSEFIAAVKPQLIISTSADFPARERIPEEWAGMVQQQGIKLFRQDQTGAVRLEFFKDHWQAEAFVTHEVFRSSSR